jgi:hypothetical protein
VLNVFVPDVADHLESRWGIRVALEMLREQVITPLDFLELCEEAAARPDQPVTGSPIPGLSYRK